ncbi:MAG: hypothetical protein JW838_11160 [Spirochaetes bacterium]|nr:hypothetical protein [Spirochaetota bacterium]
MQELVNRSILPLVNDGTLSVGRVNSLIYVKDFIDRIAGNDYIGEDAARDIEGRYGARPDVVTWGDYFQTEMATSLLVLPDEEFDRAVETLRFDMVAAWVIFSGKDPSFFEWVDGAYETVMGTSRSEIGEEEEEILHLKILKDYYADLGILNRFSESEMEWFARFQERQVI